ncbi:unnamed protein product [marine sediment metagenome]|uniref:Uncharacterized protein n=1 Tax=marine sediment metagenome TaxID=412755 RepID=X1DC50_9ZZZZ
MNIEKENLCECCKEAAKKRDRLENMHRFPGTRNVTGRSSDRLGKIPNEQLDEQLKAAEKARSELDGRLEELRGQLRIEGVHWGETRECMLRREPVYQEIVNVLRGMNGREWLLVHLYTCLRKRIDEHNLNGNVQHKTHKIPV